MERSIKRLLFFSSLLLAFAILFGRAFTAAKAIGATFAWRSHGGTSNLLHYGFVDLDGASPLITGDLVQLIWVGPDGEINPPNPATGLPAGDDQLVDTHAVENGPPPKYELGYVPLKTTNYDTGDAWANGLVYMRVWNGQDLPGSGGVDEANAYGDSLDVVQLTNGGGYNFATAPEGQRARVQTFTAVGLRRIETSESPDSQAEAFLISFAFLLTLSIGTLLQATSLAIQNGCTLFKRP